MQIQVTTDNHIHGSADLNALVEAAVTGALGRFEGKVTRVEVHLTDENSSTKAGGNDKKCVMEVRIAGMQPLVVTHAAPDVQLSIDGAADRLEKLLDRTLSKLDHHKGNTSFAGEQSF
jgi:ribosome-associated translation inhibitor RaiA